MNVPFHKAATAAAELSKAGDFMKRYFQRYEGVTDADIARADAMHLDGLRDGWMILNAIANAPAGDVAALLTLHDRSPRAFEAHMVHIRLELERKEEATVEEKAA